MSEGNDLLTKAWELARQGAAQYGGSPSKYFKSALELGWADLRRGAATEEGDDEDQDQDDDNIEMTPVRSSNLAAVGYNPKTSVMLVRFNKGPTYSYQNISMTLFRSLMSAPSPGKFFYHNIRDDYSHEPVG